MKTENQRRRRDSKDAPENSEEQHKRGVTKKEPITARDRKNTSTRGPATSVTRIEHKTRGHRNCRVEEASFEEVFPLPAHGVVGRFRREPLQPIRCRPDQSAGDAPQASRPLATSANAQSTAMRQHPRVQQCKRTPRAPAPPLRTGRHHPHRRQPKRQHRPQPLSRSRKRSAAGCRTSAGFALLTTPICAADHRAQRLSRSSASR
jgi:hypothetical protein